MSRECGPCTECCSTLGVHELDKPEFTRCSHEGSPGCKIYRSRPESCRDYNCVWIQGQLEHQDRPDRLGIVFSTAEMVDRQIVLAHVRKPGADKTGRGQELISLLAQVLPVCILRANGTRSVALPEDLAHALPRIMQDLNAQAVVEDGKLRRLPLV